MRTKVRAITVSSIFANLEKLVLAAAPRSGQALLGARWSLAWPISERAGRLTEYSFPLGRTHFTQLLARRTGLHIVTHDAAESDLLYRHLARGGSAIAAVDSFYLPYRPAFGRVHSHRTLLVRSSTRTGEVWLEDEWPPRFEGSVSSLILERARHSEVPLDPVREPIFAGEPIDGEWWSVELVPLSIEDPAEWASGVLAELCEEATTPGVDTEGEYGLAAWSSLRRWLEAVLSSPPEERAAGLRRASLFLRAELSSRVYLCAFLKAAAQWTNGVLPASEAAGYYEDLRHIEIVRDVITKSLTLYRLEYAPYVLNHLASTMDVEYRLASRLSGYVERLTSKQRAEVLQYQ